MPDGLELKPKIVVSGTTWIGNGIESFETEIEKIFKETRGEIQIVAYSISSHAPQLFDLLFTAVKNGCLIKLIVFKFDDLKSSSKNLLLKLEQSKGFLLYKYVPNNDDDKDALHAKMIVANRKKALIGSANLSWRGLVTNHEIGVILYGSAAVDAANLVDRLIEKSPRIKQIGGKAK